MPYYHSRLEYEEGSRGKETELKLYHLDDEPLSFVRLHGFGPRDIRGRPLLQVEIMSHDEALVISSRAVDVLVERGDSPSGSTNIRQVRLEPGKPLTLKKECLFLINRPKERLFWSESKALHLSDF